MDAYTLRKMVPRIAIGVIGINLSIYLCVIAIDFTNVVGGGLAQLITAPFDMEKLNLDKGSSTVAGIMGVLATLIGGSYAVFFIGGVGLLGIGLLMILTIMLIVVAIMVTLVIRQTLLILLTILSPVAIACWILPGTEKYFKQWWDLFFKTLFVYPIISALFAVSGVMASIAFQTTTMPETTNVGGAFAILTGLILVFIPLFLIPFAFRFSGGLLATVMGATNAPLQRLAKQRQQVAASSRAKNWQAIKEGNRWAGGKAAVDGSRGNFRGRLNRRLQAGAIVGTGQAGTNPLRWADRTRGARSLGTMTSAMKGLQENEAFRYVGANDDLLSAALHGNRTEETARQFLQGLRADDGTTPKYSGREIEDDLAKIRLARRGVGDRNFEVGAAVSLAGTKTGYADGAGQMMAQINSVAGDDQALARSMTFAAREQASKAQRFDLSEAGAGEYLNGLMYLRQNGNSEEAQQTVTERVADDIIANKPAGYVGAGHSNSVKNLIPALNRRVDAASEAIDIARATRNPEAVARAQRQMKQVMAMSANVLDSAASTGSEPAMRIANEHLNREVSYVGEDGSTQTMRISQMYQQLRSDPEFAQMRREYGSDQERADHDRETGNPDTPVGGSPQTGPT